MFATVENGSRRRGKLGVRALNGSRTRQTKVGANLAVLQGMSKGPQRRYQPRLNILGCFALLHAIRSVKLPKPVSESRA